MNTTQQLPTAPMSMIEIRKIIRNRAAECDASYRITRDDEVHFYGRIPNTNQTGWYFKGYNAEAVAKEFKAEDARAAEARARQG